MNESQIWVAFSDFDGAREKGIKKERKKGMLAETSRKKIETLVEEVSAREGCRLYDLEFTTSQGRRVLRVYVEGLEESVSIDQCAEISRALSLLLDVEDLIPGGHYELEVSSPGVERPLRLPWHFERALGEKVKIKTSASVTPLNREVRKGESTKSVVGILKDVQPDKFVVETEKDSWLVPYESVHKANVVFEFGMGKKINKRGK